MPVRSFPAVRLEMIMLPARPTVLICEDIALIAADIASAIEEAGGQTCGIAATSKEALTIAALSRPDIAIIYFALSDGNTGIGLALALQRLGCGIVFLSGTTHTDARLSSIPHMFVAKPLSPETMRVVLETALAKLVV